MQWNLPGEGPISYYSFRFEAAAPGASDIGWSSDLFTTNGRISAHPMCSRWLGRILRGGPVRVTLSRVIAIGVAAARLPSRRE